MKKKLRKGFIKYDKKYSYLKKMKTTTLLTLNWDVESKL